MIAKDLHMRRNKDGVEVITLGAHHPAPLKGKKVGDWNAKVRAYVPVRYVASGRKGYLQAAQLEADFVVIGRADPNTRWAKKQAATDGESAAAMEAMRERDIHAVKKRILDQIHAPGAHDHKFLGELNPSANAIVQLEAAIHMILAGV